MTDSPNAKSYARMICDYMKRLPDHYADDPQDVQDALGLSDEEFKLGLDWCVERKLIALEPRETAEPKPEAPREGEPRPVESEEVVEAMAVASGW